MNFWDLFYQLPAAVTLAVMVANVLPFGLDKRANPLLMFLSALTCLFLPAAIAAALALAVPMSLVFNWTGVRLQGHEPIRIPKNRILGLLRRLRKVSRKRAEGVPVLTREFPVPDDSRAEGLGVHVSPVRKFVPAL